MISDPDILATFRLDSSGFTSRNGGGFVSCPPYRIAAIASGRVPADAIDLPAGYDAETLEQIMAITGWTDRDVHVSARQAAELGYIGSQILDLQEREPALIDPPLGYLERQSITHLVNLVTERAER